MNGAQNQHYVPKLILRQFLSNQEKEQVSVYDKHLDKKFTTSIKNIMGERRFNDFTFEDWMVSFESIATVIENLIVPVYRRIVETHRLDGSDQEKADLGFLMAFQFLRTRAARQRYKSLEEMIRKGVESRGHRMEEIVGWEPQTEDTLKQQHLVNIRDMLPKFANIIAHKEFRLMEATPGRSFYLGDDPVCLHNEESFGPYGNLGLAVPGIEIYLPMASDLMLCAWCPSIVEDLEKKYQNRRRAFQEEVLALHMAGKLSTAEIQKDLNKFRPGRSQLDELAHALATGNPLPSNTEHMDFFNSLQCGQAFRYVICQRSD